MFCWSLTHSCMCMICACLVLSHAYPTGGARADWLQALQSSSVHPPTLTHSPLPFPAPARSAQGQVSWYKQLLPSLQGRSKGEGPYMCAKRGTQYQLLGKDSGRLQPHHDTVTTCTVVHCPPRHTQYLTIHTSMYLYVPCQQTFIHSIISIITTDVCIIVNHIPCKFSQVL